MNFWIFCGVFIMVGELAYIQVQLDHIILLLQKAHP